MRNAMPKYSIDALRPLDGLENWFVRLFAATAIGSLYYVYLSMQLVKKAAAFEADEIAYQLVADAELVLISVLLLVATVGGVNIFVFCRFVYRAVKNLHCLKAPGMHYGPGLSVGWSFLPLVSLWKPFQVWAQLWRKSTDAGPKALHQNMRWWWACWLLGNVASSIADLIAGNAYDDDGAQIISAELLAMSVRIDFAAIGLVIAACFLIIPVMREITMGQNIKIKEAQAVQFA